MNEGLWDELNSIKAELDRIELKMRIQQGDIKDKHYRETHFNGRLNEEEQFVSLLKIK